MTFNCINPLRRALPLSFPVKKGCCFKTPEMSNIMTGIDSLASTHLCGYYISASKSWDPDAPLRLLTFFARQFYDRQVNEIPGGTFLAVPSSTHRSQLCFFLLLHLFLLFLLLHLKFELVNL